MISAEDERGVHELADTDEKRFRRLRLMIDRIVGTTINEQHTAFLDCMAWNRNRTSDECFTPGDVIILTGEYRSGAVSKQVSVSLQIQNIYVKGEISDFRYPTYYDKQSRVLWQRSDSEVHVLFSCEQYRHSQVRHAGCSRTGR